MKKYKKIISEELKFLAITFVILFLIFQIHYYKQPLLDILKLTSAHYFLFILPGYSLCLFLRNKINKIERFILALGLGYGGKSVILYIINLIIKKNVLEYNNVVAIILIIFGVFLFYFNEKKTKKK